MASLIAAPLIPLLPPRTCVFEMGRSLRSSKTRPKKKKNQPLFPVARLYGPATFEASKLKVLFLGVDEKEHPAKLPRIYTLTHSDITSQITLAISKTINISQLQGWWNKLQRDEVVAEWKKVKGKTSLHVHCHISGGHFLLDLCASVRYRIFCKELPMVLKAFVHGDGNLHNNYPELQEALVCVYFHSNIQEFNKVECWGLLKNATDPVKGLKQVKGPASQWEFPQQCQEPCKCCFPRTGLLADKWFQKFPLEDLKYFEPQVQEA